MSPHPDVIGASKNEQRPPGQSHVSSPGNGGVAALRRYMFLPVMTYAVFAGSSCWFATNAVIKDVAVSLGHDANAVLGSTTSVVQLGFITGTFLIALTSLADRLSPTTIFSCACALTALTNMLVAFVPTLSRLLLARYCTGVCLAGVYPVGMKITASWYQGNLGGALGFILASLVLGTAFPHLLKTLGMVLPWRSLLYTVSGLALSGGLMVCSFASVGPYHKPAKSFDPCAVARIFRVRLFRATALGYFGHNWEIYTLWTFLPQMIDAWSCRAGVRRYGSEAEALDGINVSLVVFLIISSGCVNCLCSSVLTARFGSAALAFWNLFCSGMCCLTSPVFLRFAPRPLFLAFLVFWGFTVVGDSPHFSALSARYAPQEIVASAVTIVVCVGFIFTVISLQAMEAALNHVDRGLVFMLLMTPGPLLGLVGFWPVYREEVPRLISSYSKVSTQDSP